MSPSVACSARHIASPLPSAGAVLGQQIVLLEDPSRPPARAACARCRRREAASTTTTSSTSPGVDAAGRPCRAARRRSSSAHSLVGTITVTERRRPWPRADVRRENVRGVVAAALEPTSRPRCRRRARARRRPSGERRSARARRRRAGSAIPCSRRRALERLVLERARAARGPPTCAVDVGGDRQRRAGEVMVRGVRVELADAAPGALRRRAVAAAGRPGASRRLVVELDQPGDRPRAVGEVIELARQPVGRGPRVGVGAGDQAVGRVRARAGGSQPRPSRRGGPRPRRRAGPSSSCSASPSARAASPGGAASVSSVQPSSTRTVSNAPGATVCAASASRHAPIAVSSSRAGITTTAVSSTSAPLGDQLAPALVVLVGLVGEHADELPVARRTSA